MKKKFGVSPLEYQLKKNKKILKTCVLILRICTHKVHKIKINININIKKKITITMMTNQIRSNFQAHPFHLVLPSLWRIFRYILYLGYKLNAAFAKFKLFLIKVGNALCLNLKSPPKPYAFASLPLQSKIFYGFYCEILAFLKKAILKLYSTPKLNNKNSRIYNLKSKFTLINLFCTFVGLALVFICKQFIVNCLHLDLSSFKDYILLGIVAGGIRALLLDLIELILPTVSAMDEDIEKSSATSKINVKSSREKLIDEYMEYQAKPLIIPYSDEYTPAHRLDEIKKIKDEYLAVIPEKEKELQELEKPYLSEEEYTKKGKIKETIELVKHYVALHEKLISSVDGVDPSDTHEFSRRIDIAQQEIEDLTSEQERLNSLKKVREHISTREDSELKNAIQLSKDTRKKYS